MKKYLLIVALLFAACSKQNEKQLSLDNLKWVDLTYSFDTTTLYWPNNVRNFEHILDFAGKTDLGYYYSSYSICTPEHGGTHMDAPIHFAENKYTADQVPISELTGSAVVIDVSKKALANRDYQVEISEIEKWEVANGPIPENSIALFYTGYGKYYPERQHYFGTCERGKDAIPLLHFPGMDPKTMEWLVTKRKIKALGLDTPSLDYGQSKDFKSHQILLGSNKPGFENLANLDQLPPKGIYVIALPMKIKNGSGGPLRIIAGIQP